MLSQLDNYYDVVSNGRVILYHCIVCKHVYIGLKDLQKFQVPTYIFELKNIDFADVSADYTAMMNIGIKRLDLN